MSDIRLDTWLWAARFFKTRSMAATAINGGKVEVNGTRSKPGKPVRPGDALRIRKEPYTFAVVVRTVSGRRGPAIEAARLYEEEEESRAERRRIADQRRLAPPPAFEGKGRPTKKDRRELDRLTDS